MSIRVAINGFGRIGRNVLRAAKRGGASDVDFVCVNDLTDNATLSHLLRYDSVHGAYPGSVELSGNGLVVDGDEIRVFSERDRRSSHGTSSGSTSWSNPQGSSAIGKELPSTWPPERARW